MKKTIKHAVALPILVAAVTFASSAYAATSVVHDARGDSGSPAPYLDVVHAQVIEQQGIGTLMFMMQLAGPVPESISEGLPIWPFHVDTNTATAPGGLYNEYIVLVRWVNGAFVGQVVNRTTSPATVTLVPFSIDGTTVKVFVPLELLGNPTSFGWNASTRLGPAPAPYVDFAPNGGVALVTWSR